MRCLSLSARCVLPMPSPLWNISTALSQYSSTKSLSRLKRRLSMRTSPTIEICCVNMLTEACSMKWASRKSGTKQQRIPKVWRIISTGIVPNTHGRNLALKAGLFRLPMTPWQVSFASVLPSLAKTHSPTRCVRSSRVWFRLQKCWSPRARTPWLTILFSTVRR